MIHKNKEIQIKKQTKKYFNSIQFYFCKQLEEYTVSQWEAILRCADPAETEVYETGAGAADIIGGAADNEGMLEHSSSSSIVYPYALVEETRERRRGAEVG